MSEKPKTAVELAREAATKAGVEVEVVKPTPGTGTVTFLKKREPVEDETSK